MKGTHERAYAKLNLSLDVLGAMPDGYHEMRMVMQTVSLYDDVHIALTDSGGRSVRSNYGFLPRDGRNIALKAADAFCAAAGLPELGMEITLRKRIPVGAGLAGGSTNAAAVLRALDRLLGTRFSRAELEALGGTLGSDVPFCIAGGTQLAAGRGDKLTDLAAFPRCGVVICMPRFSIKTPELFARIDDRRSRVRPDTDGLIAAAAAGDLRGAARRMYNVFEDVLPPQRGREILSIKQRLLDAGALGAVMTGTGSAVFGIFPTAAAAKPAAAALRESYRAVFTAGPMERLMEY